jgi:hypothetical protein
MRGVTWSSPGSSTWNAPTRANVRGQARGSGVPRGTPAFMADGREAIASCAPCSTWNRRGGRRNRAARLTPGRRAPRWCLQFHGHLASPPRGPLADAPTAAPGGRSAKGTDPCPTARWCAPSCRPMVRITTPVGAGRRPRRFAGRRRSPREPFELPPTGPERSTWNTRSVSGLESHPGPKDQA